MLFREQQLLMRHTRQMITNLARVDDHQALGAALERRRLAVEAVRDGEVAHQLHRLARAAGETWRRERLREGGRGWGAERGARLNRVRKAGEASRANNEGG